VSDALDLSAFRLVGRIKTAIDFDKLDWQDRSAGGR
jgi:hypothetical protein